MPIHLHNVSFCLLRGFKIFFKMEPLAKNIVVIGYISKVNQRCHVTYFLKTCERVEIKLRLYTE